MMCCSIRSESDPRRRAIAFGRPRIARVPAPSVRRQAHFRGMKAEGGWGVVFTEFCSIHPESDEYPFTSARIWDQGDVVNLGYMCEIAHRHGSLAGIQLWYSGGNAPPSNLARSAAARANGCRRYLPRARCTAAKWMTSISAPSSTCTSRRASAQKLRASICSRSLPGTIHSPSSSWSPASTGAQIVRRELRQPLALFHRAAAGAEARAGDRCAITTRFEMDTLHGPEGVEAHEDGVRLLELFRREGVVDAVALKIGDYAEWGEDAGASRFRKSGWMTPFIKQGKSILGAGHSGRRQRAPHQPGRHGGADPRRRARHHRRRAAVDRRPFLPNKISEGRLEDIRECIGCNICVSKFQQGGQIMCTQNVTVGEEYRRGWHPEKFAQDASPAACSWSEAAPPAWSARASWASGATSCICAKPRGNSAATGNRSPRCRG